MPLKYSKDIDISSTTGTGVQESETIAQARHVYASTFITWEWTSYTVSNGRMHDIWCACFLCMCKTKNMTHKMMPYLMRIMIFQKRNIFFCVCMYMHVYVCVCVVTRCERRHGQVHTVSKRLKLLTSDCLPQPNKSFKIRRIDNFTITLFYTLKLHIVM